MAASQPSAWPADPGDLAIGASQNGGRYAGIMANSIDLGDVS